MENYERSICSTCRYVSFCSLTMDKNNISSCSEYVHRLDEDYPPIAKVPTNEPIEMFSSSGQENNKEDKQQLVLY